MLGNLLCRAVSDPLNFVDFPKFYRQPDGYLRNPRVCFGASVTMTFILEEIKRAYFDYLRRIHPDKSAAGGTCGDSVSSATFIWTTLKDRNKRREYDSWLREQQYRKAKGTVAERIEVGYDDTDPVVEPCRCGDYYNITSEEIQKIVDIGIFECASCSLCLEVLKTDPNASR